MSADRPDELLEAALVEERALVLAFGGMGIELPGGTILLNERIAVPQFNFVQDVSVAPNRVSGFLERALDQYFQRALRPTVRVKIPSAPTVRSALARLGFLPRPEARTLHLSVPGARTPSVPPGVEVRPATEEELPGLLEFWTQAHGPEPEEFLRCLKVAATQPHPREELRAVVAVERNRPVCAALLHGYRGSFGIHSVATRPGERRRGLASTLVAVAARDCVEPAGTPVGVWADSDRLRARLESIGFRERARFEVFHLPADAELALPPAGPSQGPLWRPPRWAGGTSAGRA